LALGGRLLTQQVGARNDVEFNEALGIPPVVDPTLPFTLEKVVADLESAGFAITDGRNAVIVTRYLDIGAMIFQVRAVPWQARGFDAVRHRQRCGGFTIRSSTLAGSRFAASDSSYKRRN